MPRPRLEGEDTGKDGEGHGGSAPMPLPPWTLFMRPLLSAEHWVKLRRSTAIRATTERRQLQPVVSPSPRSHACSVLRRDRRDLEFVQSPWGLLIPPAASREGAAGVPHDNGIAFCILLLTTKAL